MSDSEKVVNWSNWPLYLDIDDATGTYPRWRCSRRPPASR
jgi:hypothetical protein